MPERAPLTIIIDLNFLMEIVRKGGSIITGIDVFSPTGNIILAKDVHVKTVSTLLRLKQNGIRTITISPGNGGGLWDRYGRPLPLETAREIPPAVVKEPPPLAAQIITSADVKERLEKITELKQIATQKYDKAKTNIKSIVTLMKDTGGEINVGLIEETVTDLFDFIIDHKTAFSYLTRDIFSYDDYLFNHSINVCTIGTVVLQLFNNQFNEVMNRFFSNMQYSFHERKENQVEQSFQCYFPDELRNIAIGYFMHDLGKVLIPSAILNKQASLTSEEFAAVKQHSLSKGIEVLEKNRIYDQTIKNIIQYHHARLFAAEERCYPEDKPPEEIPPYVRICKLADIYDAMTSKRSYKEAMNPVGVVAEIFHKYAEKDYLLQFIIHSFVKAVGIFPPGSIVYLQNGQLAYVLDSLGPVIVPITDKDGRPIAGEPDPLDLGDGQILSPGLSIDRRRPLASPAETYGLLPPYLKKQIKFW